MRRINPETTKDDNSKRKRTTKRIETMITLPNLQRDGTYSPPCHSF